MKNEERFWEMFTEETAIEFADDWSTNPTMDRPVWERDDPHWWKTSLLPDGTRIGKIDTLWYVRGEDGSAISYGYHTIRVDEDGELVGRIEKTAERVRYPRGIDEPEEGDAISVEDLIFTDLDIWGEVGSGPVDISVDWLNEHGETMRTESPTSMQGLSESTFSITTKSDRYILKLEVGGDD